MTQMDALREELAELKRDIRMLQTMSPVGYTSITEGMLRVASEEGLRVEGSAVVVGLLDGTGNLVWSGPWKLSGLGEIEGDVTQTGDTTQQGNFNVVAPGKITVGNIRLEDGKIYVGVGPTWVVLDGATGKITAGGMSIDPTGGGKVTFPGGAEVKAGAFGQVEMTSGDFRLYATGGAAGVQHTSGKAVTVTPGNIRLEGLPTATSVTGMTFLAKDLANNIWSVPQDVGGPLRTLMWPFDPSTVTSEYGPRDLPPPASAFHEGIDFGVAEGTPIPAIGSGVVTVSGYDSGFGNYVVVQHTPTLHTLYAHMRDTPLVSVSDPVARNQTIGLVGNTGASLGPHLHLEIHVGGVPVNPRSKLPPA